MGMTKLLDFRELMPATCKDHNLYHTDAVTAQSSYLQQYIACPYSHVLDLPLFIVKKQGQHQGVWPQAKRSTCLGIEGSSLVAHGHGLMLYICTIVDTL